MIIDVNYLERERSESNRIMESKTRERVRNLLKGITRLFHPEETYLA